MVQHVLVDIFEGIGDIYGYTVTYPEAALLLGILVFLLLRGKMKSALILFFGIALCFANYYVFLQYNSLAVPLLYAAVFAGVSVFLLLLLVYQFIHTA